MEPSPGDVTSLLDRWASGDREAAAQFFLPGYEAVPLMLAFLLLTFVTAARPLFAQTTVGTGSTVGTVSDPSAAVVVGAKVIVTNLVTGQVISLATNSSGAYNSGALIPGNYRLLVSAKGFSSVDTAIAVLVGNTATVNVSLQIGQENQAVEVQGSAVRVNTEQPTVQGVLDQKQIENLPVNGRNFLEPGVLRARCPPADRVRAASHLLKLSTQTHTSGRLVLAV